MKQLTKTNSHNQNRVQKKIFSKKLQLQHFFIKLNI